MGSQGHTIPALSVSLGRIGDTVGLHTSLTEGCRVLGPWALGDSTNGTRKTKVTSWVEFHFQNQDPEFIGLTLDIVSECQGTIFVIARQWFESFTWETHALQDHLAYNHAETSTFIGVPHCYEGKYDKGLRSESAVPR